ncbi:uncharacterized protein LOC127254744 [Andrographis paniculata]|uniref:uncharacterized protein LOC127254744 n=1 Tax=Andrographis paniculata TaxID=175694 RepID=UPI0021E92356|nr:uncharacterized protein LOC127254744 [Andrographis paniculata]XP_051135962.1 uncharacterized protein LOC127254744 [Andrographis paniculata]XP_051135963.1 uncharacterized protein LOC127254744 [Andrographis paniculata]
MASGTEETTTPQRRLSCTKCFDALWFCYSPVHQMQQYYRVGVLDNCSEKWSSLIDCLTLKTKRASEIEEVLKQRESNQNHIWTIRSPDEARANWNDIFGHLNDEE